MTDRELMQMALDALDSDNPDIQLRAAIHLRARLAQPEPEPVAFGVIAGNTGRICRVELDAEEIADYEQKHIVPLYTAPPQREWQGLTDEDIRKLSDDCAGVRDETEFIRAIEAKLKEKNNG